ncbi:hypothetical protein U9M48_035026 [Paspalum notatum var. saurae]|uniref:Prolamin-like domain-containing protein n=1 Tax=Paspalum notatum var. saurae TaxID=547442 RepID=A0AAQ3UF12_PASNO
MAPAILHVVATALALLLVHHAAATPPPAAAPAPPVAPAPGSTLPPLAARLHAAFSTAGGSLDEEGGGGGLAECWAALTGLRSCTGEMVVFFVNGESYIGPECCVAIRGATRNCWPAMLAYVGFTAEEADVLRGFCDAEASQHLHDGPPAPAPRRSS